MTRQEQALSELIAEVDQHLDAYHAGFNCDTVKLENALEFARTALRHHIPADHCFDRTNKERKD